MNIDDINIEIEFVDNDYYKNILWTRLRQVLHILYWSQNPGRNLKYFVKLNGKIIGLLSLGSDVM